MIINEELAIQIIKDDLGLDIVNLELDDATIKRNIQRALIIASSYYSIPTYKTVDVHKTTASGGYVKTEDIDVTGVNVITAVYPTTNVLQADAALLGLGTMYFQLGQSLQTQIDTYASMVQRLTLLESILGRNARLVGDKLYIDHYYNSVTVAYIPKTLTIETVSDGDWLRWILEYTVALSKRQLAQTRGKYIVTSNPATTNAATLLEEANSKLQTLEEVLVNKGILPISR